MSTNNIMDFVVNTSYESLPKGLARSTRFSILDTIGAALDGVEMLMDSGQPTHTKRYKRNGKEAFIIGTRYRVTAEEAFWNNSRSCSLYDQDGIPVPAAAYPGRQVILATLAAAEKLDASIQDAVTVFVISYELLLRTGYAVRDIGWPPSSPYPSKTLSPYCFTVPGVAGIAFRLVLPALETGGVSLIGGKVSSYQAVRDTQSSAERYWNQNQNARLPLLTETFRLLQNGTDSGLFPVQIANTSIIDKIAEKIANSDQLTYSLGQTYLLEQQGFKPALINRYLHHPLAAVKQALEKEPLDIDSIKALKLKGLWPMILWATKFSQKEAHRLMALLLVFLGTGVDPEVPLVLNGPFNTDKLGRLKAKIRFEKDDYCWLDWLSESHDFPFSASLRLYSGVRKEARVIGNIYEIKDLSTRKQLTNHFKYRSDIIGEESGKQLSGMLRSNADFAVTDLMRLTGITWRDSMRKSLSNLFLHPEPDD
ncbi:MAG: MmgE/PrpD family protein [Dehalococcoidales bacterium]|nr:MmgE/PrpD family protein [Dehalococcoidales bacterium]